MKSDKGQQLVISGVGGQGVLFVTRLLAEAAIDKGLPVFTSETHGMAQRGGTVISHLKVGEFSSPMIRPGQADGLLVLHAENLALHGAYARSGAWAVVNQAGRLEALQDETRTLEIYCLDAAQLAETVNSPRSSNLVVLGRVLSLETGLFCNFGDIVKVLEKRLASDSKRCNQAVAALETGLKAGA